MKTVTVKLIILCVVCFLTLNATAQKLDFSRPTIITSSVNEEPLWHEKVYEDAEYLFVIRDYGKAEYTPNFFVYEKNRRKWIEIKKLSTEHAKLGHSSAKTVSQTSWDYSSLKSVNYVNLPLRASGSINFPDKITYHAENKIFCFNFNSSAETEEMLTQFWVLRKDLDESLR